MITRDTPKELIRLCGVWKEIKPQQTEPAKEDWQKTAREPKYLGWCTEVNYQKYQKLGQTIRPQKKNCHTKKKLGDMPIGKANGFHAAMP